MATCSLTIGTTLCRQTICPLLVLAAENAFFRSPLGRADFFAAEKRIRQGYCGRQAANGPVVSQVQIDYFAPSSVRIRPGQTFSVVAASSSRSQADERRLCHSSMATLLLSPFSLLLLLLFLHVGLRNYRIYLPQCYRNIVLSTPVKKSLCVSRLLSSSPLSFSSCLANFIDNSIMLDVVH